MKFLSTKAFVAFDNLVVEVGEKGRGDAVASIDVGDKRLRSWAS